MNWIQTKIRASNASTIAITFGSIGYLAGIKGSGVVLFIGVVMQFAYLFFRFAPKF